MRRASVRHVTFEAVVFDWRGTLVTTLTEHAWVSLAVEAVGMPPDAVGPVLAAIEAANGPDDRLDGPGVDSDAALHRSTYLSVFRDAGLRPDLAEALYALEGDLRHNPFADDVAETFRALRGAGVQIAVLSDIHVDLRPAFAGAGLLDAVACFTLSFEQGVQKPDPRMFTRTAEALGVPPERCLMVGDRSRPDGPAVEQGMTTLLLPPLRSTGDRRLHHVLALCGLT